MLGKPRFTESLIPGRSKLTNEFARVVGRISSDVALELPRLISVGPSYEELRVLFTPELAFADYLIHFPMLFPVDELNDLGHRFSAGIIRIELLQ